MQFPTSIQELYVEIINATTKQYIPLAEDLFYSSGNTVYDSIENIPNGTDFVTGGDILSYIHLYQDFIIPNDINVYELTEEELYEYSGSSSFDLDIIRKLRLSLTSTINSLIH